MPRDKQTLMAHIRALRRRPLQKRVELLEEILLEHLLGNDVDFPPEPPDEELTSQSRAVTRSSK